MVTSVRHFFVALGKTQREFSRQCQDHCITARSLDPARLSARIYCRLSTFRAGFFSDRMCLFLWLIERGSFWFLAYRTRNVKFEATDLKRSCFGVWIIERGILHLERASCGLWLTEQGMLHLKRACFGTWLI